MDDQRARALIVVAADLLAAVDTSARYGVALSHTTRDRLRKRLNDALHPDYHTDRYGGLSEPEPYVNDAVSGSRLR